MLQEESSTWPRDRGWRGQMKPNVTLSSTGLTRSPVAKRGVAVVRDWGSKPGSTTSGLCDLEMLLNLSVNLG